MSMERPGGWGKAMAGRLSGAVNGKIEQRETTPAIKMPARGERIRLFKHSVGEGKSSAVGAGTVLEGALLDEIRVGEQIRLDNGDRTSIVQGIQIEGNRIMIRTETSVYEFVKSQPQEESSFPEDEAYESQRAKSTKQTIERLKQMSPEAWRIAQELTNPNLTPREFLSKLGPFDNGIERGGGYYTILASDLAEYEGFPKLQTGRDFEIKIFDNGHISFKGRAM